jgi:hypothetical protein
MSLVTLKVALLWCAMFNYSILLLWLVLIIAMHDWFYGICARFFRITLQTFDVVNYGGIAAYKLLILVFNFVPYVRGVVPAKVFLATRVESISGIFRDRELEHLMNPPRTDPRLCKAPDQHP